MFFVLRAVFWLSLVFLFLPTDWRGEGPDLTSFSAPKISTGEAIGAASATIAGVERFCGGHPGACETGRAALSDLGSSSDAGVRWLVDRIEKTDVAPARAAIETAVGTHAQPTAHRGAPSSEPPTPAFRAPAPQASPDKRAGADAAAPVRLPVARPVS